MTDVHIFGTSIMKATLLDPKTQLLSIYCPSMDGKVSTTVPLSCAKPC